jgi:hypothetical protein
MKKIRMRRALIYLFERLEEELLYVASLADDGGRQSLHLPQLLVLHLHQTTKT